MKRKITTLFLILNILVVSVSAQTFSSVKQLAQRRVPWLANKIIFTSIPKENGKDVFILQTKNKMLSIAASGENAAAKALGYYLKNYCHRSM